MGYMPYMFRVYSEQSASSFIYSNWIVAADQLILGWAAGPTLKMGAFLADSGIKHC